MLDVVSAPVDARAVVLVEGRSDAAAVTTLAERHGRDLADEGVVVIPMGGATNFGHYLEVLGPHGRHVTVTGLCDADQVLHLRRALGRAGFGSNLSASDIEALGFHVCEADLEDELIRSLGPARVEQVISEQGELRALRTFQQQPAQRGRTIDAQLRRFMGTHSGRKLRYGRLLVAALDLDRVPRPLMLVLSDGHPAPTPR